MNEVNFNEIIELLAQIKNRQEETNDLLRVLVEKL